MTKSDSTLEKVETDFGVFFVSREHDPIIYEHLTECGAQQRGDLEMILSLLAPGAVVIDVGAHIGSFAIPLARHVGENGRVYALEGSPDTFKVLEKNISENDLTHSVIALNAVVSSYSDNSYTMVRASSNRGRTQFHKADAGSIGSITIDGLTPDVPGLDFIKIDGSFIRDLDTDTVSQAMVTAMIKLARSLDIRVVAEQVENRKSLDVIRALGVDFVQGYVIGRPRPLPVAHAA